MPIGIPGRTPLQIRWAVAMVVLAQVITCTICIGTSYYLQHKWCGLMYAVEAPNIHRPTAAGKQFQAQIHDFRVRTLGCENK